VVARNLASADVGLVGFANIFIGFLSRFTGLGIDNAIVQRKKLEDRILSTALSVQIALAVMAFLATVLVAPFASTLIGHRGATAVIVVLGTTFVLNAFAFLPTCLLTRDLEYRRLTLATAGRLLARHGLVVALVLSGF